MNVDPIEHYYQSPYVGFDSNPVFYADPTGTSSIKLEGQAAQDFFGALKDEVANKQGQEDYDDWIKRKGKNSYVWNDEVTGKNDTDIPQDYEYVGKNLSDVDKNYNSNLSLVEKIKKSLGIRSSANINYGPYLSAMLSPIINIAFSAQRNATKRFVQNLSSDYYFNSIDTNLDPLLPKGPFNFASTLCIGGKSIPATIEYINRNSDANFITQITAEGTYTTFFSQIYSNTFHLSRGTVNNNIKVFNLSGPDYNYLTDFIWNKN